MDLYHIFQYLKGRCHAMKALYVQMMALYFFSKLDQLLSSNIGVYAVKTCNFCSHAPTILGRS